MKKRNGLVSNSSSSSFIIAVKDENKTRAEISFEVDFGKYSESFIRTDEDLEEYMEDVWEEDWKENSDALEQYTKMKNEISSGKIVLCGSFSSEGDEIEQFLCNNGIPSQTNSDITIIESSGGY